MKIDELKEGDTVIVDNGFSCMQSGKYKIKSDFYGRLFIVCSKGFYHLEGQVSTDGELIGITKAS